MKNLGEVRRAAKLREVARINFDDTYEEIGAYWRDQWEQSRRFLAMATLRAIENGATSEEILEAIKLGKELAREEAE